MSNYAMIVAPLNCLTSGGEKAMLHLVEVRNISIGDDGVYGFEARVRGDWYPFKTSHDLPYFTDKGRAQRAENKYRSGLRRGRPSLSQERMTKKLPPLRVNDGQFSWVTESAKSVDESTSEFIRRALYQAGMPK